MEVEKFKNEVIQLDNFVIYVTIVKQKEGKHYGGN